MATWILTGSLENFRINVERGFDVVGFKERRRNQALEFEPGDEIVFYVTGVQAFGGIARVRSEMFGTARRSGRRKKSTPEDYPWRVEAEPVTVLDEADFIPAKWLGGKLRHLDKWPAEHWHLAFQGQLRTISDADGKLLGERIRAASRTASRARVIHDRHFTVEEATALLPSLDVKLRRLRDERDRLTDAEAHELLADAAPANGGGQPGREVGEAFLAVRALLGEIQGLGIVVRDVDRGLIDFPAILEGREVYLAGSSTRTGSASGTTSSRATVAASRSSEPAGRRPLTPAERIVVAGALVVAVSLLLPWYGIPFTRGLSVTGVDSFGFADAALLITVGAAVVLVVRDAAGRKLARPLRSAELVVAAGVWGRCSRST